MTEQESKINRLVAEKVMGWTLQNSDTCEKAESEEDYLDAESNNGWFWNGRVGQKEAWEWKPSEDIACAFEVVYSALSFTVSLFELKVSESAWSCRLAWANEGETRHGHVTDQASAPLAICMAALDAFGVKP